MDLAAAGRALFARMVKIAGVTPGTKTVTFTLISASVYDPDTGTNTVTSTVKTIVCFVDNGDVAETKQADVNRDTVRMVMPADALPRQPDTQDEALIDGVKFLITETKVDSMGVQMYVYASRA